MRLYPAPPERAQFLDDLCDNLSACLIPPQEKKVFLNHSWPVGFAIFKPNKYRMQKFYDKIIQPAFGEDGCT